MNIDNMRKVTMSDTFHHCGSAACIMGSTWLVMSEKSLSRDMYLTTEAEKDIQEWLDVTQPEFRHIWLGLWAPDITDRSTLDELAQVSQKQAVRYLDLIIEQGRVVSGRDPNPFGEVS
jgi:hypothetical protein